LSLFFGNALHTTDRDKSVAGLKEDPVSTRNRQMLAQAVAGSYSIRATLTKLGLAPAGGNYESIKKAIRVFGIDTSHFTGQGHLRGKTHNYGTRPLRMILKRGKLENTFRLKRRLIAAGIKPPRCECCGLIEWRG